MAVAIAGAAETAVRAGTTYYFCGAGCRRRFERDPESHLAAL
jgi:YHS domain-containing protein